ncbi:uncharacterized protein LOC133186306 [Saccostrea echinata]|uniref:uncharacterized protein LOC133186306 n=1 Tax=Saccostrea echinata TaxID=191078 RepID=UPI002A7EF8BD|nr:uncharacterized protein LOC133186306 [Saccostrea echinata]
MSTMEELENVQESSQPTSEESSQPTSESYGSSITPKSTSDWDSHFVDELGVESTEAGMIDIILKEWHLAGVPPSEIKEIEATVEACLIEDLDKAFENMTVSEFNRDKFGLNRSEMAKIDNKHPHLKKTFVPNILHFTFALERIFIDCLAKREISEGKYELLFENLLKSFGFFTLNHSHIGVEKSMIRGKTMSSKADILCIRRKPLMEKEIICVCQVKKSLKVEDPDFSPQRKKLRSSNTEEPGCSYKGDAAVYAQHIGELFVYFHQSVSPRGILGFTIEKTWVRVTYLEVQDSAWDKIRKPANRGGSVKYEATEKCPQFKYSRRYNILDPSDRRVLFKALFLIQTMLEPKTSLNL